MDKKPTLVRYPVRQAAKVALVTSSIVASLSPAQGAEWVLKPGLQTKLLYDTNIYVSSTNPISLWGISVSPRLAARRLTANSGISLGARAIINHYSHKLTANPDAQFITLRTHYSTLTDTYALNGRYRGTTTSTSVAELQTVAGPAGAENVINVNLVPVEVRMNTVLLKPSWNHAITAITNISASYLFDDVFFGNSHGAQLYGYKQNILSLGLNHRLTQRDTLGVLATAAAVRKDQNGDKSDSYGLQATYDLDYSETLHSTLRLGARTTSIRSSGKTTQTTGLLLMAVLKKRYSEVTSYYASVQRNVYPSGAGAIAESDVLQARLNHKLSPRLNFLLWGTAFSVHALNQNASGIDRIYLSVEPTLRYALTQTWSLEASYRYRWQKYSNASSAGDDHAVFVAVNYDWPRIAVSR